MRSSHKLLGLCIVAVFISNCGFNPMKKKNGDKAEPSPIPAPTKVEGAFLTACEAQPEDALIKTILGKYSLSSSQCDEASVRLNRELSLELRSAGITDVGPLAGLKQLRGLDIAGNKVSDISVIASLPDLSSIDLTDNTVSTGPVLIENCKLSWFSAGQNKLTNLDFLASCHSLQSIHVTSNPVSDLSFAKNLTDLMFIQADKTEISNIGALSGKPKLSTVSLVLSKVSDLSPLRDAANLYYLGAGSTPLDKTDPAKCPVSADVVPALRNYCNAK